MVTVMNSIHADADTDNVGHTGHRCLHHVQTTESTDAEIKWVTNKLFGVSILSAGWTSSLN